MSDADTNGFSNAFDEHIRSISKQVIEEEFAKRQIGEGPVVVIIIHHEHKRNSYKCASTQTGLLSLPKLKP